jgi:hypothetical protein
MPKILTRSYFFITISILGLLREGRLARKEHSSGPARCYCTSSEYRGGALPNRRPYLEPRNDERRGTEDHAKRGARQLLPRRKLRDPYLQEFEIIGDGEEVTAGLII